MKKEDLNKILKFSKTPKGKAVMFFAFYFVFFVVVGILFRSGSSSVIDDNPSQVDFDFNIESITNNNYRFTYDIVIDDTKNSYTGIRYGEKEEVNYNQVKYYSENDNYFIDNGGVWIKADNPYLYKEFYSSDYIYFLIKNGSYLSKTEYDSGKKVYNYSISSASINNLFFNSDLDVEEIPNEIIITVDEYEYVNKIKFNLNSYCKIKNICANNMVIELSYEDYGNIEEIISPLS